MRGLLERLNHVQPGHTYAQQVLAACKAEAQSDKPSDPNAETRSGLSDKAPLGILTQREIELLHLLADGLTNKEIATRLYVSTETVKTHLQNIYGKLHTKGRIGALKEARRLGLITHD